MASRRKRIGIGIGILAVAGVVVGVNATRESRNRVEVQTDAVATRDLVSVVSASGEVRPQKYVDVGANVSGRIVNMFVQEGDRVRSGQVLARIDSTRIEAGLRQAEAALAAAQAELARTEADLELSRIGFERVSKMHAEALVSDQDYDASQAELRMKSAALDTQHKRVAQQQASLAQLRDDFEKTTVLAPMDGVVTSLQKEEGEVVIGAQSFQPTVIMTIGDLSVMEAEILVDETDIRDLALGQDATVKVDALGDRVIHGKVTEIGSSAIPRGASGAGSVSSGSVSSANQAKDFKVVVTLDDPPETLRPGLNATADIVTARKSGVLAVPIQAVVVRQVDSDGKVVDPGSSDEEDAGAGLSRPRGTETDGVFLVQDGKARFHPVRTGILGESDIEVVDGLEAGQTVVSGSYKTLRSLRNEARVKVEEKDEERS